MSRTKKSTSPRDSVHITATQRGGEYADVVEFAHEKASEFGSAVNAMAQAVRSSSVFSEWEKAKKRAR